MGQFGVRVKGANFMGTVQRVKGAPPGIAAFLAPLRSNQVPIVGRCFAEFQCRFGSPFGDTYFDNHHTPYSFYDILYQLKSSERGHRPSFPVFAFKYSSDP